MLVKSKQGIKCPRENKPREYIEDTAGVEVPDTSYYRRRIADGSLVEVKPVVPAVTKKDKTKGAVK
jgi:hypothetical protein